MDTLPKNNQHGYSSISLPDGRKLAYSEYGDSHGKPVIYFHGFPGSRVEGLLMDAAAKRLGLRIVAPDRPGFGRSDFQAGRRLSGWPKDVAALADALSFERFSVLGISGGGPYVLACAEQLAERIDRASIVCGLGPARQPGATRGMNPGSRIILGFSRIAPKASSVFVRGLLAPCIRLQPKLVFTILAHSAPAVDQEVLKNSPAGDIFLHSFTEALHQGGRGLNSELFINTHQWDIHPGDIRIPITFWHGDSDTTVPLTMSQQLSGIIPDATLHTIKGQGHFSLPINHMDSILGEFNA